MRVIPENRNKGSQLRLKLVAVIIPVSLLFAQNSYASQNVKLAAAERWFHELETASPLNFIERFADTDEGYYYKTLGNVRYGVSLNPSDNQYYKNVDGTGWVALGNYKSLYRSMQGQPITTIGHLSGAFYNTIKDDAHFVNSKVSPTKSILVDGKFSVSQQEAALINASYNQGYSVSLLNPTPNGVRRLYYTLGLPSQPVDQSARQLLLYGVAKNNRVISIEKPSTRPVPYQVIISDYIEWVRDTDRLVKLGHNKEASLLSAKSQAQQDIAKIASAQTFEKIYTYKGAIYSIQTMYWTIFSFEKNKNYVIAEVSPMLSPGSAYSFDERTFTRNSNLYNNLTSSYKFEAEIWGRNNTDKALIISSSPKTESNATTITSGTEYSIGGEISTGGVSFSGGATYSSATSYSIADISVTNLSASKINNAAWLFSINLGSFSSNLPSVATIGTFNPRMSWVWQINPPSFSSMLVQQRFTAVMKNIKHSPDFCTYGCIKTEDHQLLEEYSYYVNLAEKVE